MAMVSFFSLFLASSAAVGLLSSPIQLTERQTASQTGYNNGFYYQVYNGGTYFIYTNGAVGSYTVNWDGNGDFVVGKGWNPGGAQDISYTANYAPDGGSYLSVYGWFTKPLVENYIVESWDDYIPSTGGTYKGSVNSDRGTYDIYLNERVNQPSIEGTSTFNQYWSVHQHKRTNRTVTTENHFNAWHSLGLETGTFNYRILAVEAFSDSGEATITVE